MNKCNYGNNAKLLQACDMNGNIVDSAYPALFQGLNANLKTMVAYTRGN